ncbi:endonuclease/exonuclease/phosphatase family protein [Parvularcula sp. LCG005]|uniref:endonuclease/exonuclease/phosphatase family protein n=1 Tax=Parvularcula sp. LCG005 TaxID=3078805 RepID=UPI002942BA16|nr:endonuclease/exonuclease/phosphatase family protein [Parvularcula sp. LCG005]WOI53231.1 endonuclease/exonuclease/phosphatase family protein [Parvularcula sp. LCG005]
MKKWALGLVLLCAAGVGLVSCMTPPDRVWQRPSSGSTVPATETISVLTWNLGYGGLGAQSDFVADGGENVLPPSRSVVGQNVKRIVSELQNTDVDIFLLQELARPSPVNWWTDVLGTVDRTLDAYDRLFYADLYTRWNPPPFRFSHGLGVYSRMTASEAEVVPLPLEEKDILPGTKRQYGLLVTRLVPKKPCGPHWTIIDLHLSAFDESAGLRHAQLEKVMQFATAEYAKGRHVILGGDWNLLLVKTDFPHTTKEKDLFWIHDFPADSLPPGWRIAADDRVPSVRTNEKPYVRGENFRGVIDGFVVSPNVRIDNVFARDTDFSATDHQPVQGIFHADVQCGDET